MVREINRSPWRWTVLGLLRERPMHPYELQRLVGERGKDLFVEHKMGSLYGAITQLRREGLIAEVETSRVGRMPERTSYRVTDDGIAEFDGWLERELRVVADRDFPRVIVALEKLTHLAPDRAAGLLRERAAALEQQVGELDTVFERGVPRVALLEADYARTLRQAELDWLRGVLADLEAGRLAWDYRALTEEGT